MAVAAARVASTAAPWARQPARTSRPAAAGRPRPQALAARACAARLPTRTCAAPARAVHRQAAHVPCRVQTGSSEQGDFEAEALASQGFVPLAKTVAAKLASELAWHEQGVASQLKLWFDQAGAAAEKGAEQVEKATEKAASITANVLGVSASGQAGDFKEESPAAKAARYLGADAVDLTVDSVKGWLTSPERRGDVKMIAALVYKMLQFMEKETGESFQGEEHQYKWLARLAQEVFGGGSMTKGVVRALVDAFLRVPGR